MTKNSVVYAICLLVISIIYQSCKKNNEHPVPFIESITPAQGSIGTQVIITGKNFGAAASANEVTFNGAKATITSASATQLITTVPTGASTGKITVKAGDKTVISSDDFTVVGIPTITSFSPAVGVAGTQVVIIGTNFSSILASNTVTFGNVAAIVTSATATGLTVTVPAGATTGKVTITTNGLAVTSDFTFVIPPTITSFSPASGVVGTQVIIVGTNFSTASADNIITFYNNQVATVTNATTTQLTVTIPNGAITGKIGVTINGASAMSAADFSVPTPTITGFSPAYALAGKFVTITGTNFSTHADTNVVKFAGTDAVVTNATSTQLTVTVPAGANTGKITTMVGSQTATSATDFEVLKDIPRSGLVAFYPFTGNANDISGNNLHGTLMNNGPSLSADRFGQANQSYSFDGVKDYIDMGNPPLLQISTQITVGGWVMLPAVISTNQFRPLIAKIFFDPPAGGSAQLGYDLDQSGNKFRISFLSSAQTQAELVGTTPAANTWIFVAFTIDDKDVKFYQNGILVNTYSYPSRVLEDGSKGNLIIGNYNNTFMFYGSMDDVTIYNRPLNATEIQQLYNQTITKY